MTMMELHASAEPCARRPKASFSSELAKALCRRVAEGESVARICADPGMPTQQTVGRWARRRKVFRQALQRAREAAGWVYKANKGPGFRDPEGEAAAAEIFARMCAGEPLTSVCDDPRLPGQSTVYRWRKDWPELADAISLARRVQAERFAELGWEIAEAATPETAYLTHVRLMHIRWMAGVYAPEVFGRLKPLAPRDLGENEPLTVVIRQFTPPEGDEAGATFGS